MIDYWCEHAGQLCRFIVNTVNAGSGALAVTIDGPSKVQLSCREIEEGYEFTYSPSAPGDYLITIKYAGSTHIPGSPFKAHIEGMIVCHMETNKSTSLPKL